MCRGGAGEASTGTRTSTNRFFRIVYVAEMEAANIYCWEIDLKKSGIECAILAAPSSYKLHFFALKRKIQTSNRVGGLLARAARDFSRILRLWQPQRQNFLARRGLYI